MQQLFPREGETQPRLRFPEFQDAGEWEDDSAWATVVQGASDYGVNAAAMPVLNGHRVFASTTYRTMARYSKR